MTQISNYKYNIYFNLYSEMAPVVTNIDGAFIIKYLTTEDSVFGGNFKLITTYFLKVLYITK